MNMRFFYYLAAVVKGVWRLLNSPLGKYILIIDAPVFDTDVQNGVNKY